MVARSRRGKTVGERLDAEDGRAWCGPCAGGTCVLENKSGVACQLIYRELLLPQNSDERGAGCWFGKSGWVIGTGHAGMLMLANAPGWR